MLAFADVLDQADYVSRCRDGLYQAVALRLADELVIGDALSDERRRVLLTPGHYLGNWSLSLHSLRKKVA